MVCKTIIRRFKSARRLHLSFPRVGPTARGFVFFALAACPEAPPAPPVHAGPSTAPYVEWRRDDEPVRAPVVVVVDAPGGPMDRLVADPDVTTFLNDRFHPVFRAALEGQPAGTVRFYDGCGCPLTDALAPGSPAAFVDLANAVIVRPESRRCTSERLRWECLRL